MFGPRLTAAPVLTALLAAAAPAPAGVQREWSPRRPERVRASAPCPGQTSTSPVDTVGVGQVKPSPATPTLTAPSASATATRASFSWHSVSTSETALAIKHKGEEGAARGVRPFFALHRPVADSVAC